MSVPTPSSRFQTHEKLLVDELARTLAQIVALEIFQAK
jgi:hypothetical protein